MLSLGRMIPHEKENVIIQSDDNIRVIIQPNDTFDHVIPNYTFVPDPTLISTIHQTYQIHQSK